MSTIIVSRRDVVAGVLGIGIAGTLPMSLFAEEPTYTKPVATASGKVRGKRANGVSSFLGVPYGADTAPSRFQAPKAASDWKGVRDCFAFGAQAVQGYLSVGAKRSDQASSETNTQGSLAGGVRAIFASAIASNLPQSEECLFLNVFTAEASTKQKKPVMVWLHGGGFAMGTAGSPAYDGSELARRGDVVVVTLNHRLSALGYLYLGGLADEFADSGNAGQLDIVLALQWVKENIAAFGGDPRNVTIFGESGGAGKVGALLGMPAAKGLFHKAIQESGPAVHMVERAAAMEVAERTLAKLGVAKADVHKLTQLDPKAIITAASESQLPRTLNMAKGQLAPVVDGHALPAHPFSPAATEISRDVPLIIGSNKDEGSLFLTADPKFGQLTEEEARVRFHYFAGDKGVEAFDIYRASRPNDSPTYWVAALMSDLMMRVDSIREAERKAAQRAAPVYMYRFDWEPPVLNGALRAFHGAEVALVFGHTETVGGPFGGPEAQKLSAQMLQAWVNFAHTGNPSQSGLDWPTYEETHRQTLIFNADTQVVSDPDPDTRKFWEKADS
jgi:para-nitrobenzyl esterase